MYYGEVPSITLTVADRRKLGVNEWPGQVLLGDSCEGAIDGNLEYGSEDSENSEILYLLGAEGGYDIGFSDEMF